MLGEPIWLSGRLNARWAIERSGLQIYSVEERRRRRKKIKREEEECVEEGKNKMAKLES